MPIILATQEGSQFVASLGKMFTRPYLKGKGWVWWFMYLIQATEGSINRGIVVQAGKGKK
jgi:hypothetical protein